MSMGDRLRELTGSGDKNSQGQTPKEIPKGVEDKLKRGRANAKQYQPQNSECMSFWRGDQYTYRNKENVLLQQNVIRGTKPNHRVRTTRNLIVDMVAHEVSAATSRVPSFEVDPSTNDPDDQYAAQLAQQVALYGYDKWHWRQALVKAVTWAVVTKTGEGFVWPYFDTTIGPYVDDEEGQGQVGIGDIRLKVYGPNEVYWEPGKKFEDSPWHAIEQAMTPGEIKSLPGFNGVELQLDASTNAILNRPSQDKGQIKMTMVTQYLERPSPQNHTGSRIIIANNKVICPVENYPLLDPDGEPVDEPVLHEISYWIDPDSDRNMGLVPHLLDPQRTVNDGVNKILEWKNLALNPQILAPIGSIRQKITDEPGAVVEYAPIGGQTPQWRAVQEPPQSLFTIVDQATNHMGRIAAQNDLPSQVESGKGQATFLEKDQSRRQDFFANLADFHSRLMRHCLYLVARHYTEPRLLKIRGQFGVEPIEDFRGSQLRSQVDVRVFPASIEPRTREYMTQQIMNLLQLQLIPPDKVDAALSAMQTGVGLDKVLESYELDVARAQRMIQKIKQGPDEFMKMPTRPDPQGAIETDPMTGQVVVKQIPGWMPRPGIDNVGIHKQQFGDWMKTEAFELSEPAVQEACQLYFDGLVHMEQEEQMQQAAQQAATAQDFGQTNAAKPSDKPMPSMAAMPDNGGPPNGS